MRIALALLLAAPCVALEFSAAERALIQEHLPFGLPGTEKLLFRSEYVLSHNNWLKVPNWVAYRLTREDLAGRVRRSEDFRPDPQLKPHQRAELPDYRASGYDRGHLAPAADMRASRRAMSESFLLSNMAPQAAPFNRGIWEDLESRVRDWARRRGEAFVVTGPVFLDEDKDGVMSFRLLGPSRVAVPTHFYKIVVAKGGDGAWDGVALLMPNRGAEGARLADFLSTIDAVERATGLDFLEALPDDVEERLESRRAPALWD